MQNELVVQLLGEGGSRALYAVRDGEEWLFSRWGPIGASCLEAARRWKGVVIGWPAALGELDHFGAWYELSPRDIHPEFADALLQAVHDRDASPRARDRWEEGCSLAKGASGPVLTATPIHSSDQWLYLEDPT